MEDLFKIYIERLREGEKEELSFQCASTFLELEEEEVSAAEHVNVKIEAYLTESHLILRMSGKTKISLPCSICNELTEVVIEIQNLYHNVPLEEITNGIYDFSEALREGLLLELPLFAECNQGACPKREEIRPYLKKDSSKKNDDDNQYFPFSDL